MLGQRRTDVPPLSGHNHLKLLLVLSSALLLDCCRQPSDFAALKKRTTPSGVKVLLIGIDGATFKVIRPLLDEGRLPHIGAMVASGATGILRSEDPMRSPALWTTIATGQSRQAHGIIGFYSREAGGKRKGALIGSSDRKTLALWNIASAFDLRVGVAGWWATWPAEQVNGWMISDRITRERWNEWAGGPKQDHAVYPEELTRGLQRFIVDPASPPMETVERILPLTATERSEFLSATKPVFGHWLSVFKFAFCSQLSNERMTFHLLSKAQPYFAAVFLVANDPVSHTFWHFYEPAAFPSADTEKSSRLGRVVPNFYEHNDAYLGEIRRLVGNDTVVMIVSDHGFEATGTLPADRPPAPHFFDGPEAEAAAMNGVVAVGQSGKHHRDGVLIVSGGPIRRGVEVNANIYDIAPTVLALLGLPVPEDMQGRVLTEIIEPGFLAERPVTKISTYEGLIERRAERLDARGEAAADKEKEELLRSLGYIQ
ncbi:MAG: alkaline phosphatase family protein [Acidobacteriota bacterium]